MYCRTCKRRRPRIGWRTVAGAHACVDRCVGCTNSDARLAGKWTHSNLMDPSPPDKSLDRPEYCGPPHVCGEDWVTLFQCATLAEELLVTMKRTYFVVRRIGCQVCCAVLRCAWHPALCHAWICS